MVMLGVGLYLRLNFIIYFEQLYEWNKIVIFMNIG